jgi:DNA-binding SARP family transcriptional activator
VLFAVGPELAGAAALTAPAGDAGSAVALDPVTAVRADSTIQVTASGHGSTWHVDDDGTTRTVAGAVPGMRRLPVLDQTATTTILTSLGLLARPSIVDGSGPARAAAAARDPAVAAGEPVAWPDPPPAGAGQPRRLQIRVLGEPQVLRPHPDGIHSPVRVRRSAGRQLLVLFALHRDGVAADVLKEAIWPDVPSSAAHRRFLTTMSELGRALHDAAGQPVLRHDDPAASAGPARYRLDPAAAQVDIWQLQDLLLAAVTSADPAARRALLGEAAALDGGELAAGWDHAWLLPDRERLARRMLDIYADLADAEPDHTAALRLLHRALLLAPGNEAVYHRLLQRRAQAGDPDGVRRATATLTEHRRTAGRPPAPSTVALPTWPHTSSHRTGSAQADQPAATERTSR